MIDSLKPVSPFLSVITPVYFPPVAIFRALVDSMLAQTFANWEWWLVNASPGSREVEQILQECALDQRVHVISLPQNLGISGNTNKALELAAGEYVFFLDHDDTIDSDLFEAVADLVQKNLPADIIYFDEGRIMPDGSPGFPFFKLVTFSPEMLFSTNYLAHAIFRRSLVTGAGGLNSEMDGAQDWDLALRCVEKTNRIVHLGGPRYHWRLSPASFASSADNKPYAFSAQLECLKRTLERRSRLSPRAEFIAPHLIRVAWESRPCRISIIVEPGPALMVEKTVQSILAQTDYPEYEILVVPDDPILSSTLPFSMAQAKGHNLRLISFAEELSGLSRVLNLAARQATGDCLLFLASGLSVTAADWLAELSRWFDEPQIGVAGLKIINAKYEVQHAGGVLGLNGVVGRIFKGLVYDPQRCFGDVEWLRNYSAVSIDCLMTRRNLFEQLDGFDPSFQDAYFDADFCLRAGRAGFRTLYLPNACLVQEYPQPRCPSLSYASDLRQAFLRFFPPDFQGDPFYNPGLSTSSTLPRPAQPEEDLLAAARLQVDAVFKGISSQDTRGGW